jgi:hypothetical protein
VTLVDPDETPDEDEDDDTSTTTTLLGVVSPVLPPAQADAAVRGAAEWVEDELTRLRVQRSERDREGLAEIDALRRRLIEDRKATNAQIRLLVAEQARLRRLVRVLDTR